MISLQSLSNYLSRQLINFRIFLSSEIDYSNRFAFARLNFLFTFEKSMFINRSGKSFFYEKYFLMNNVKSIKFTFRLNLIWNCFLLTSGLQIRTRRRYSINMFNEQDFTETRSKIIEHAHDRGKMSNRDADWDDPDRIFIRSSWHGAANIKRESVGRVGFECVTGLFHDDYLWKKRDGFTDFVV